jgi:uncharacterized glyoxalase superfamily protein PhnB
MRDNRSIPACTVIPELGYEDVGRAIDWLCKAFGFELRLRIADHRAQLTIGEGAIVLTKLAADGIDIPPEAERHSHAIMVRIDDADRHYERAKSYGVTILATPADYPYGERQYTCRDLGGHIWTFSQSIADVAPEEWGGVAS